MAFGLVGITLTFIAIAASGCARQGGSDRRGVIDSGVAGGVRWDRGTPDRPYGVPPPGTQEAGAFPATIGGELWPRLAEHPSVQVQPEPSVARDERLPVAMPAGVGARPSTEGGLADEETSRDGGWIEELICSYDWPCSEALAVAWCESRYNPQAVSGDGQNFGLFQINAVHRGRVAGDLRALLDAATNVRVAYAIYRDNHGWGPWSCRP